MQQCLEWAVPYAASRRGWVPLGSRDPSPDRIALVVEAARLIGLHFGAAACARYAKAPEYEWSRLVLEFSVSGKHRFALLFTDETIDVSFVPKRHRLLEACVRLRSAVAVRDFVVRVIAEGAFPNEIPGWKPIEIAADITLDEVTPTYVDRDFDI